MGLEEVGIDSVHEVNGDGDMAIKNVLAYLLVIGGQLARELLEETAHI